jgi:hypothetical protein
MNTWPRNLLKQKAEEIGTRLTSQIPDLEKSIASLSGELDLARAATARAETFPTSALYCPACWMNGDEAILIAMANKKLRTDSFRCFRCRETFDFSFWPERT